MADSISLPLVNQSCDPQLVTLSANGQDFSVSPNSILLDPYEKGHYTIYFTPTLQGVRTGTLHLLSRDQRIDAISLDTTLPLSATAIAGDKALAASLSSINFGETNVCDVIDTTLTLTNPGCEAITIYRADIDRHFAVSGDFPIVIPPGGSVDLSLITAPDTSGKPTALSGLLTIESNADEALASIPLSLRLVYPTKLRIEVVDNANGTAQDIVRFRIILEGAVPSSMTALHFDFLHNNDLLSFISQDGAGLSVTSTTGHSDQRQGFTLAPVRSGVLGEVSFKVHLAEAEQTTLAFDNIHFEAKGVSFAPECIAVISDYGSQFSYDYTCGDGLVRDGLRGVHLIKSLSPNPASQLINIQLNEGVRDAVVTLHDALGVEVLRVERLAGSIDVRSLPSGTYQLTVSSGAGVQRRQVIIER
jgi:hypothetical protein